MYENFLSYLCHLHPYILFGLFCILYFTTVSLNRNQAKSDLATCVATRLFVFAQSSFLRKHYPSSISPRPHNVGPGASVQFCYATSYTIPKYWFSISLYQLVWWIIWWIKRNVASSESRIFCKSILSMLFLSKVIIYDIFQESNTSKRLTFRWHHYHYQKRYRIRCTKHRM